MNRRQFSLLIASGLVGLPRRLRADTLLGSTIELPPAPEEVVLEHWRAAKNNTWRWFEKSEFAGGEWRLVGATLPLHRDSGEPVEGDDYDPTAYVSLDTVPEPLREAQASEEPGAMTDFCVAREGAAAGPQAIASRRARDGRPPSHWVRELSGGELRWWLAHLDPPEAGVSGMTFLEHLTEGHGLELAKVESLTLAEQAKLHGAVHHGY